MQATPPTDPGKTAINGATRARYTFFITENHVFVADRTQTELALQINRKEFRYEFIPHSDLSKHRLETPMSVFAIFGVIEIGNVRFLVAVTRAECVGRVGDSEILKIDSIKFLTISRDQYVNFDYESCYDRLERIKEFLKVGFYFSYSYKLQGQFAGRTAFGPKEICDDLGKNHFIWNYKSLKDFMPSKAAKNAPRTPQDISGVDLLGLGSPAKSPSQPSPRTVQGPADTACQRFFVPFIQGFFGTAEEGDTKVVLLSRRSYLMGGTRYNNRGVDNAGHVANYVETELLLFQKTKVYRFFQIRGSLPFYWEQVKGLLNPAVEIHQRLDINQEVMSKHVRLVTDNGRFKKLAIINLLARKRSDEETLSAYLVQLLEALARTDGFRNAIMYEHIDFHAVTRPTDFSPIDKHVYQIWDQGCNGGEFGFDVYEYADLLDSFVLKSPQPGLIRTNCLDCLDRTNAMQTKFGHYALFKMLERSGAKLLTLFSPEDRKNPLPFFEKAGTPFFEQLRRLWANNGDLISLIYAGTGATTSSVTRKGEKSTITSFFDHKLKTVRRFYLNTFDDGFKQEIIDVLLHKKSQSIRQSTLYQSNGEFGRLEEVTLHVVTMLSVAGNAPLTISEQTVARIFEGRDPKDLVLVVARNDSGKQVELRSAKLNLVCASFLELFHMAVKLTSPFKMVEEFSNAQFTLMLWAHRDHISRVSYSKSDKVSVATFQSAGQRTSLIVEHVGIEVFCFKADPGAFSQSAGRAIEKIFDKYIDKEYDLVLFVGHVEGYEPEKPLASPKYQRILEEVRPDAIGGRFTNLVTAFCSRELLSHGFVPETRRLVVEDEACSPQLTFSSFTFQIKKSG